jgi:hypothetical protein
MARVSGPKAWLAQITKPSTTSASKVSKPKPKYFQFLFLLRFVSLIIQL